jgi:hypothetical protein
VSDHRYLMRGPSIGDPYVIMGGGGFRVQVAVYDYTRPEVPEALRMPAPVFLVHCLKESDPQTVPFRSGGTRLYQGGDPVEALRRAKSATGWLPDRLPEPVGLYFTEALEAFRLNEVGE